MTKTLVKLTGLLSSKPRVTVSEAAKAIGVTVPTVRRTVEAHYGMFKVEAGKASLMGREFYTLSAYDYLRLK